MDLEDNHYHLAPNVLIYMLRKGCLTPQAYRKKTHIDRCLHANSHHYPTQKVELLKTLVTQAIHTSSSHSLPSGKSYLTKAIKAHGYSTSQILKSVHCPTFVGLRIRYTKFMLKRTSRPFSRPINLGVISSNKPWTRMIVC